MRAGPLELVATLAVVTAFAVAFLLVVPAARRRLGLLHPAVAWLGLEAVFFGIGSVAAALADAEPGPAFYVAGAVLAAGAGVWVADRLSQRRENGAIVRGAQLDGGLRPLGAPLLALASVVAISPTLIATGIPLLTGDITAARS